MSFIEVWKNFLGRRPPDQNVPTGEVAWDEATYIPSMFSAGITEIRSGKFIKAESGFTELLVVYDGECEIEEIRSKEKHTMKKGDLVVIRKGARLKLEPSSGNEVKYVYVTIPPYQETGGGEVLNRED